MAYLLDTSAWLTHLFSEEGVVEVRQIFYDTQSEVYVSALSLLEVYVRLKATGRQEQWPVVQRTYKALFTSILPVDEQVALLAVHLRQITPVRLPTVDGLIAATAAVNGLTLVHRDAHLAAIPFENLRQVQLPARSAESSN
jgi:predicted nucleic acid-binding protein